jgi:heat-inducible transcriptional repressor
MEEASLSEREIQVLEAIVRNYILTAQPTGSRCISKMGEFALSPATIRNVMGDLEDKGLIMQPHTSAGRIPTDKGYRFYVDQLVRSTILPAKVKNQIKHDLTHIESSDLHLLMEATSKALCRATDHLGVVLSPRLRAGVFKHIHIFKIDANRYLMNLTIDSGFVKTVVVELASEIDQDKIEAACRILNHRYYGKTLEETFCVEETGLFENVGSYELGVIRLFIPSIQKMLEQDTGGDEIFTEGKTNILLKPEFFNKDQVSSVVEILEEKRMLMHFFGGGIETENHVVVSIGGEIEDGVFSSFSVVKTPYRLGGMSGYLGVIGPKRMPYPFLISAVDYTSKVLGELYS